MLFRSTYGQPTLTDRVVAGATDDDQVLQLAASLERYSKHPLARPIVAAAEARGLALSDASELRERPGGGLEGVVNGQFQVTSGTTLSFLVAAQKNGPIRTIGNRLNNEWTLTGISSIQKCDDTNGKIWAHHTESAVSTAMARIWLKNNCAATTKPQEVYIQGSDVRAAALKAGQIDIAELELGDAYNTTAGANASKFRIVANFSADLPNLKPSMIAANTDWLSKNPGDVLALLTEITKQNRKINADTTGAYLKSLAQKWVPKAIDANTIDTVAKAYVEKKLFPSDGGAATTDIEYTIKFFTDGGSLDKGLTVQQASDLTFLNTVLKALGPA